MARRKNNTVSQTASLSINPLDLDLDAMLDETVSSMEEKARSTYGFYLPLSNTHAMAERLLGILETKDIPLAMLGNIATKMVVPFADGITIEEKDEDGTVKSIVLSAEARTVQAQKAYANELWADIRKGAAYSGRKVSCKERPDLVGEWLRLYMPKPRKAGEAETDTDE